MSDLDKLRDLTGQVWPPPFESLVTTARRRTRRAVATATAACAVVILAIGGGALLGGGVDRSAPGPANPSVTPTETSEAVPGEPTYSPDPGEVITLPQRQGWSVLRQGRYTVRVTPSLDYQVDVPDNYRALSGRFLNTPVEGPSIFFVAPAPADRTRLPVRPCRDHTTTKPVGPTVSDLAEALRDQPLLQVSKPVPVTLDSHKGLYLEVRIPLRVDPRPCTDNKIALWSQGPDGWLWEPGYLGRWWILDVHGQRTVVMPQCDTSCPDTQLNTLTQMAESITFTTKQ